MALERLTVWAMFLEGKLAHIISTEDTRRGIGWHRTFGCGASTNGSIKKQGRRISSEACLSCPVFGNMENLTDKGSEFTCSSQLVLGPSFGGQVYQVALVEGEVWRRRP